MDHRGYEMALKEADARLAAVKASYERDLHTARDLIAKALRLQWSYEGYGRVRCRSCGGHAYEDEGKVTRVECSDGCPYRQMTVWLAEEDARRPPPHA